MTATAVVLVKGNARRYDRAENADRNGRDPRHCVAVSDDRSDHVFSNRSGDRHRNRRDLDRRVFR
jgi:hypothetical protein